MVSQSNFKGEVLKKAASSYLELLTVRNNAKATHKFYKNFLPRVLGYLGDRPLDAGNVAGFLKSLSCLPGSVRTYGRAILSFVSYCELEGFVELEKNFRRRVRFLLPEEQKKRFPRVSEENVLKAIEAATKFTKGDRSRSKVIKTEAAICLKFILAHGTRIGETLKLKGSDLNLFNNPPTFLISYYISKNRKEDRDVPIALHFLEELHKGVNNEKLFTATDENLRNTLKRGCRMVGIPELDVHDLRKIRGNAIAVNNPAPYTQQILRHAKLETTLKYYVNIDMGKLALALNNSQSMAKRSLKREQIIELVKMAVDQTLSGSNYYAKVSQGEKMGIEIEKIDPSA